MNGTRDCGRASISSAACGTTCATELEKAREEARTRQQQIYEAMQSLEGKYARITQSARGTIVSLADILFDFDKATLKRNVEFSLVKVATILNQFSEMRIAVEGHTDNIGNARLQPRPLASGARRPSTTSSSRRRSRRTG